VLGLTIPLPLIGRADEVARIMRYELTDYEWAAIIWLIADHYSAVA